MSHRYDVRGRRIATGGDGHPRMTRLLAMIGCACGARCESRDGLGVAVTLDENELERQMLKERSRVANALSASKENDSGRRKVRPTEPLTNNY